MIKEPIIQFVYIYFPWIILVNQVSWLAIMKKTFEQTFKDNATAHAPLFLKWFQLKSKWSIVSLAANKKNQVKINTMWHTID